MTTRQYRIAVIETVFYGVLLIVDWRVALTTFLLHWGWNIYKNRHILRGKK